MLQGEEKPLSLLKNYGDTLTPNITNSSSRHTLIGILHVFQEVKHRNNRLHLTFCHTMLAITLFNSPILITDLVWHGDIKYPNILRMVDNITK